ncbi:hypothetical protein KR215_010320 [Drosophila sulfurigaster]|uniref:Uncharacterized protein LOC117576771 n=1 Tax=Drosophila albomicans TaxID=7291 RepID=A0A6P8XWB0_DROAB|nr:uncharacterized protein LOC117576771 [Drosophila albomicans]XP_062125765.1 uncharacterized protein LOC133838621 [Drosophila sulfurigaster albostrigata]KAH8402773.1 hypothetical protein KR215_010320 [Drosophila sulfurigaster]
MDSTFGSVFLFLTDLAWKSRLTIPVLVTTAFLVMDIRLQIEINIQTGQVNASDLDESEDDGFEEHLAAHGVHHMDDDSEAYSDDLEEYNSEYTNGDGNSSSRSNSDAASHYSAGIYDDLGSDYDAENELEDYYALLTRPPRV